MHVQQKHGGNTSPIQVRDLRSWLPFACC